MFNDLLNVGEKVCCFICQFVDHNYNLDYADYLPFLLLLVVVVFLLEFEF